MKNISQNRFEASLSLDEPDDVAWALAERRLATYSVEALRAASQVDKIHVLHDGFNVGLRMLDRLFQLGTELEMPHGARLVGATGVGKTAVFRYFRETLPKSSLFSNGVGVIGLRVPRSPKLGHFVGGLLNAIGYPFATGSGKQLYQRRHLVFDALKSVGTRLVWLDEAQHLIHQPRGGNLKDWDNDSTEFLRELMDECRVALVLSGTDELDGLPKAASHLAARITIREEFKDFEADANWVGFVLAFAKQCRVFDLGLLGDRAIAKRLHIATDGNLRSFKRLVTEGVLLAVDGGVTQLDRATLSRAFSIVNGCATTRSDPFA